MHCPRCRSSRIFRDRYQGVTEWLRFTPLRPYGCRDCHHHFVSWRRRGAFLSTLQRSALRSFLVFSAACPNCRAHEVERIKPIAVRGGAGRVLARWLGFPAYRCSKCGKKFFKFRWHVRYSAKPAPTPP